MRSLPGGGAELTQAEAQGLGAVFAAVQRAGHHAYYVKSRDDDATARRIREDLHSAQQILDTILHGAKSAPTTETPEVTVLEAVEAEAEGGIAP